MAFVLGALLLAAAVGLVVVRPLLQGEGVDRREDERRAGLEAAKEAKYREIRDAELDFQVGKVSERDWQATDGELRGQAIEILRRLDRLEPEDR